MCNDIKWINIYDEIILKCKIWLAINDSSNIKNIHETLKKNVWLDYNCTRAIYRLLVTSLDILLQC